MDFRTSIRILTTFAAVASLGDASFADSSSGRLRKREDIVIYRDPNFYAAFPSIVQGADGELLVAFRRAPERRAFGEKGTSHTDPNSYLVLVRSRDFGNSWSPEPELMFAHPLGGSQDPCMVRMMDGSILCTSYAWALVAPEVFGKLKAPVARLGNFTFLGGFLLRSHDVGHTWKGPIIPPPCAGESHLDLYGKPIPAYNRGALCEGKDGRLFWVVATTPANAPRKTQTHLMISSDKGVTWTYSCPVARDENVGFNETSLYQTRKGDLVAFLRTENYGDRTCIARSSDGGKSFQWKDAGFQGHPHHAIRLSDGQVLLVYGYRHRPFGIRARILNPECTNTQEAEEIVLRDDGGNGDLGYPWAVQLEGSNRVLVVYYFNHADGPRHIAGTWLELDEGAKN